MHRYRMLGSFDDSEDLVQETFLRAWRGRATFQGRSSFRAWLYKIATNACLDALRGNPRRVLPAQLGPAADPSAGVRPAADLPWLQPYPDELLERVAPSDAEPEVAVVAKETIELAFLATIQLLPPPPVVGVVLTRAQQNENRRAFQALQLCYLLVLSKELGGVNYIGCVSTVQMILKRNDEIEARRRGTPARAAQAERCRSVKVSRRGKALWGAARVRCTATPTGLRMTFRRLPGGPSLRSLFGRKAALVVGRSRFDSPAAAGDRVNVKWRASRR